MRLLVLLRLYYFGSPPRYFSIAYPAIAKYGLGFIAASRWSPVEDLYGALPQIYGTIMSSLIALLIAVPLGVGVAVFLSEDFCQPRFELLLLSLSNC